MEIKNEDLKRNALITANCELQVCGIETDCDSVPDPVMGHFSMEVIARIKESIMNAYVAGVCDGGMDQQLHRSAMEFSFSSFRSMPK